LSIGIPAAAKCLSQRVLMNSNLIEIGFIGAAKSVFCENETNLSKNNEAGYLLH